MSHHFICTPVVAPICVRELVGAAYADFGLQRRTCSRIQALLTNTQISQSFYFKANPWSLLECLIEHKECVLADRDQGKGCSRSEETSRQHTRPSHGT